MRPPKSLFLILLVLFATLHGGPAYADPDYAKLFGNKHVTGASERAISQGEFTREVDVVMKHHGKTYEEKIFEGLVKEKNGKTVVEFKIEFGKVKPNGKFIELAIREEIETKNGFKTVFSEGDCPTWAKLLPGGLSHLPDANTISGHGNPPISNAVPAPASLALMVLGAAAITMYSRSPRRRSLAVN